MIISKELRDDIASCWDEKTSYFKEKGSRGQCFVTALLVQDLRGGYLASGFVIHNGKKEKHYWNRIGGNQFDVFAKEIDLTSDQYGGDGFNPLPDERIIDKKCTLLSGRNRRNPRYLLLKKRFKEKGFNDKWITAHIVFI